MKTMVVKSLWLALIISLFGVRNASAAYIDPNTGGMVFQLLAVLFGVLSGVILLFSSKIRMAFFRVKRAMKGQKTGDEETDQQG